MKEEVKRWWDYSKSDLNTAEYLFRGKKYKDASFYCQQAVEKALKALSLKEEGKIKKIHDLVELGKDVNLPSDLIDYCKELTLAYIYSRYPDVKEEKNMRSVSANFLKYTKEILKWTGKKI